MKNSQKLLKAISAFTLTSVLLILVYYIGAIYPFGDHALFKWDMELQYIDFFHWWHRVLHGQASMSYSLSKSLGDNAIGLTAYYLSSPFNLLLYFTDNIPLFVSIATVLKLASASLTVSVFLSYRFCDMKYIWNLLLSVSYGLMGYNLCQASNIRIIPGQHKRTSSSQKQRNAYSSNCKKQVFNIPERKRYLELAKEYRMVKCFYRVTKHDA